MKTRGSILVGLLWCVAILSIVVVGTLHAVRLELRVSKNYGDMIQAHYLAVAGIEKARALLYLDIQERQRAGRNHTGDLYDDSMQFREVPLGRGDFTVFRQGGVDEGGRILYGIRDEESRLNLNQIGGDVLGKLPGMTSDSAAVIMGYREKVLPFRTIRELLTLQGISRAQVLGEDANFNGLLDPEEDDGNLSDPPDNGDGVLDAGWSGMLTIHSSVRSISAFGKERIDIQSADENTLASVEGITSEIAKAIVGHRGNNTLESLADLLDVPPAGQQQNQGGQAGGRVPQGGQQGGGSGGRVIEETLLLEIADDLTVGSEQSHPGLVNINTADAGVLACLPGVDHELARAIIRHRESSGYFSNTAWLLRVPGVSREIFKQVAPRVTARSETFRILSEGTVKGTGARKRIEVIVQASGYDVRTLAWREDL